MNNHFNTSFSFPSVPTDVMPTIQSNFTTIEAMETANIAPYREMFVNFQSENNYVIKEKKFVKMHNTIREDIMAKYTYISDEKTLNNIIISYRDRLNDDYAKAITTQAQIQEMLNNNINQYIKQNINNRKNFAPLIGWLNSQWKKLYIEGKLSTKNPTDLYNEIFSSSHFNRFIKETKLEIKDAEVKESQHNKIKQMHNILFDSIKQNYEVTSDLTKAKNKKSETEL